MTVGRANPAVIARFGMALSSEGVVVLDPGQYGARAGLQPGDVIRQINKRRITDSEDVRRALSDPGRWLTMELQRRGQTLSLRFRL